MRRVRVTCPASILMFNGERPGQLWDLSETGARLKLADPPERGETVVLSWREHQVSCQTMWSDGEMCGLSFDKAIDSSTVAETAQGLGLVEQPIAAVSNIAIGRKRSRIGSAASEPHRPVSQDPIYFVALPRPASSPAAGRDISMSPAEEMFFNGSPLAHVIDFQRARSAGLA